MESRAEPEYTHWDTNKPTLVNRMSLYPGAGQSLNLILQMQKSQNTKAEFTISNRPKHPSKRHKYTAIVCYSLYERRKKTNGDYSPLRGEQLKHGTQYEQKAAQKI